MVVVFNSQCTSAVCQPAEIKRLKSLAPCAHGNDTDDADDNEHTAPTASVTF